jgi:hypothetical protein
MPLSSGNGIATIMTISNQQQLKQEMFHEAPKTYELSQFAVSPHETFLPWENQMWNLETISRKES